MFFKKKDEQSWQKYKAIYKSLYSEKTIKIFVSEPTDAMAYFLQGSDDGVFEMYMLIGVIPSDKVEH